MNIESEPNEYKIYRYIEAIKNNLPEEIRENKKELSEILDEIESHLLDLISELANAGPITDDIVKQAINQTGSPLSIARAYYTEDMLQSSSINNSTIKKQESELNTPSTTKSTTVLPEELQFKKWKAYLTLGGGILGFIIGLAFNHFVAIAAFLWILCGIILYIPIIKTKYQEYPNLLRWIMNSVCFLIIFFSIGGLLNSREGIDGFYSFWSLCGAIYNIFLGIKRSVTNGFKTSSVATGTTQIGEKNLQYLLIYAYVIGIIGLIFIFVSFFLEFLLFLEGIFLLMIGILIALRRAYFKFQRWDSTALNIIIIIVNIPAFFIAMGIYVLFYPHPMAIFSFLIMGLNLVIIFFSWKNGLLFKEQTSIISDPTKNQSNKNVHYPNTIRYIPQVNLKLHPSSDKFDQTQLNPQIHDSYDL